MSDIAIVYTTFPTSADAARIAEAVVEERLAACANILAACTSVFRWQGAVTREGEVPALFKTAPALAERLRDRIAGLHPYDLPVIEMWPAAAATAVSDWVAAETGA